MSEIEAELGRYQHRLQSRSRLGAREGHSWPWASLYLGTLTIPEPLQPYLATIFLLRPTQELERLMVNDLIANGEESKTHLALQAFWGHCSNGVRGKKRRVDRRSTIKQGKKSDAIILLSHWAEEVFIEAHPSKLPFNPYGMFLMGHIPESTDNVIPDLMHTILLEVVQSFINGDASTLLNQFIGRRNPPELRQAAKEIKKLSTDPTLAHFNLKLQLVREQEYITDDNMMRFFAMVEEYNAEWAVASFDWRNGDSEPSSFETFQRLVDDSPWARKVRPG